MRADRLLAALLVLQARGRVTAAELAAELEVSVRTARRDLEALAVAGVPVYPQRGRGGGWRLVGGARTDLTGFTDREAHALLLSVGSSAAASPSLRAAVRKLVQALPETFRGEATSAAEAVVVDPAAWGRRRTGDDPVHLEALQEAVVRGRRVELGYAGPDTAASRRVVHPLGLVTKAGVWYVVAGTDRGQRTFRVSRVTDVGLLDDPVERPPDFDLGAAWDEITTSFGERTRAVRAHAVAEASALGPLRWALGDRLDVGDRQPDGRFTVVVAGWSVESVVAPLAGLGGAVEVRSPPDVRRRLAEIARELHALYVEA